MLGSAGEKSPQNGCRGGAGSSAGNSRGSLLLSDAAPSPPLSPLSSLRSRTSGLVRSLSCCFSSGDERQARLAPSPSGLQFVSLVIFFPSLLTLKRRAEQHRYQSLLRLLFLSSVQPVPSAERARLRLCSVEPRRERQSMATEWE